MNRLKSADNLLHQVALENFVRCNTLENLQKEWESLNPIRTSPTARRTRGCVQAGGSGWWFHLLC